MQVAALRALAALATPEACSGLNSAPGGDLPLECAEALLLSPSHAVAQAARDAIRELWGACYSPIPECLERCYAASSAATANALQTRIFALFLITILLDC